MVLSEIIVGIISKAGISLLHSGLNYVWSGIKKDQNILRQVELTVNELSNIDPITIDKIEDFLLSQEVDCIIKQIFSAKILKTENEKRIHDIEIEFSKLLILHVNLTNDEYQIISPILFKALVNSCIRIYEEDIEKNHIATSQEKLGNYRFQILLDYIENLDRNLELLKNKEYHTVQEYLEFEQQYRFQMVDRYQTIRPIHFEEAQKITLDSIYVAPNFTHSEDLGNGDRKEISNVDFINRINRCVVLGDPGAGKTTLSKKICYDFARGLSKTQYGISDFTPIYVELRDYGLKLESNGFSIIQYIEYTSNTFLQKAPPEGFFDYILVNGRAFVIFDGLDELLDTSKRQLISDNIDSFCNQYPTTKILVTSRKVGYEQAPLSQNRFNLYYISDFNPEQVKEYVSKWFSQNFDLEKDEKEKKVIVFLKESYNVKELRSNPLILSLMCDLYRGEGYIPKNRPDVYEKCSNLLFEKWDKIRGINNKLRFEAYIKRTLMYIAFQIYSDEKLQGGVPEKQLINITVNYLYPSKYDDEDYATELAKEFIDFCRGRAWVFTEIGSPGQNLYQFTHRTFLEYFTAFFLVRNYKTPPELIDYLFLKIIKREWDVVAQLSFQIQNTNIEDAGNDLILSLIQKIKGETLSNKFFIVSFIVRCLEFMVLSPNIILKVVECSLYLSIELNNAIKEDNSLIKQGITIDELLNPLLIADSENITSIKKAILQVSSSIINNDDTKIASSGLNIISSIPQFKTFMKNKGKQINSQKIDVEELIYNIIQKNHARISEMISINWENAQIGYSYDLISIDRLITIFGPGILFSFISIFGVEPTLVSSLIDRFFYNSINDVKENPESFKIVYNDFVKTCKLIQQYPIPWNYTPAKSTHTLTSRNFKEFLEILQSNVDIETTELQFPLFQILAPLIEHELYVCSTLNGSQNCERLDKGLIYSKIESSDCALLDPLLFIFRAKLLGYNPKEVEDLLIANEFLKRENQLIYSWIKDEIHFLQGMNS